MVFPDLTNQLIRETYQRILQKDEDGTIKDGTGSLFVPPSVHTTNGEPVNVATGSLWYDGNLNVYLTSGSSNSWFSISGTSGTSGVNGLAGTSGSSGSSGTSGSSGSSGMNGQSNTFFDYTAKTSILSGNPSNGYLSWNNETQINSTQINVSHLTRNGFDVDIFLGLIPSGSTIIIQDYNNSNNFQKWNVGTGIEVEPNSYWEYPITHITGSYSFSDNSEIIFVLAQLPIGASGVDGSSGTSGISTTNDFRTSFLLMGA